MTKIISTFLLITLLSNIAYAEVLNVNGKSVITPLAEGQNSPFAGLLLSPQAVATIVSEKESFEPRCKLRVEHATQETQAKCDFALAELKTKLEADVKDVTIKLDAKTQEITELDKKLKDEIANRPSREVWSAVGFGGGVLVTLLSAFLVSKASK